MEKIRIRDPGGKVRIRDKHPGSATLLYVIASVLYYMKWGKIILFNSESIKFFSSDV